jgi:hypothetical protein
LAAILKEAARYPLGNRAASPPETPVEISHEHTITTALLWGRIDSHQSAALLPKSINPREIGNVDGAT